jgi:TRAP-type C4-dicarboxylate transport system permease small subunit
MQPPAETATSIDSSAAPPALALLARLLTLVNLIIVIASAIAMILACAILSYSVISRSFFQNATYWQDEAAIFLLVGATFLTAAYVQSHRGHIGIEAFTSLLSPRLNHIRALLVDFASLAFCAFFAWKSWTLTHEAYVDGQISNSIWGPPLAIPYSLMSIGMTLLCIQILLQILTALFAGERRS